MTGRRDMPGRSSSRTAQLEERIREIEAELDNVHDDMRMLRRVVAEPDRNDLFPQYRVRAAHPAVPAAAATASQESPDKPAGRRPLAAVPPPSAKAVRAAAALPGTHAAGLPTADGGAQQPELMMRDAGDHERFASYFTSGSLHALQPLRRERRTQRNRAIVALVFFCVALFWVLRLIF